MISTNRASIPHLIKTRIYIYKGGELRESLALIESWEVEPAKLPVEG